MVIIHLVCKKQWNCQLTIYISLCTWASCVQDEKMSSHNTSVFSFFIPKIHTVHIMTMASLFVFIFSQHKCLWNKQVSSLLESPSIQVITYTSGEMLRLSPEFPVCQLGRCDMGWVVAVDWQCIMGHQPPSDYNMYAPSCPLLLPVDRCLSLFSS